MSGLFTPCFDGGYKPNAIYKRAAVCKITADVGAHQCVQSVQNEDVLKTTEIKSTLIQVFEVEPEPRALSRSPQRRSSRVGKDRHDERRRDQHKYLKRIDLRSAWMRGTTCVHTISRD